MSVDALTAQAIEALTDPHMAADVRLETLRLLLIEIDKLSDSASPPEPLDDADPIAQAVWALRSTGLLVDTRLAVLRTSMQALDTQRAYEGLAHPAALAFGYRSDSASSTSTLEYDERAHSAPRRRGRFFTRGV